MEREAERVAGGEQVRAGVDMGGYVVGGLGAEEREEGADGGGEGGCWGGGRG